MMLRILDLNCPPGDVTCLATVCSSGSCLNMEAPSTMAWLASVAPPMVPIMLTAARPEPVGRAVCWLDGHPSDGVGGSASPAACCSLPQACRQRLCFTHTLHGWAAPGHESTVLLVAHLHLKGRALPSPAGTCLVGMLTVHVTCLATDACQVQQPIWQLATLKSLTLTTSMFSHPLQAAAAHARLLCGRLI